MKHAHYLFAALTVAIILLQAFWVYAGKPMPNNKLPKWLTIASHVSYTGVAVFGLLLFIKLPIYPYWLLAKILLFVVAMSASFKALRASSNSAQRKTGLFVTMIAMAGLLYLAFFQPDLGMLTMG